MKIADKDGLGAARDEFYQRLMTAHEGLSEEQGHALNARLVLILANELGDPERLRAALELARSFEDG